MLVIDWVRHKLLRNSSKCYAKETTNDFIEVFQPLIHHHSLIYTGEVDLRKGGGLGYYGITFEDAKMEIMFFVFSQPRGGDINCYLAKSGTQLSYPLDKEWVPYRVLLPNKMGKQIQKIRSKYPYGPSGLREWLSEIAEELDHCYAQVCDEFKVYSCK